MEQKDNDIEVPLPERALTVGIFFNLKKGLKTDAADEEAEYDSIDTITAICSALEAEGHHVILFEVDQALPDQLKANRIDIAFNIAEGFRGRCREAQVPAMLDFFGIPFTGSDETTLCLALDKALTKRLLATYDIRTPRYAVFSPVGSNPSLHLNYPVIVKPNAEGSSKGISDTSIVRSEQELLALVDRNIRMYQQSMLAEEYIEGREFTVGVLGNGAETKIFSPMEIIYKRETNGGYHVYSYTVKQNYKKYVEYCCPANLTFEQENEMIKMSEKIYEILGCKDFSRIDYRMSADGKIYFIEINPLPGLAPGYSDYPMLAEFQGVSYKELVNGILNAAVKRINSGKRGGFLS